MSNLVLATRAALAATGELTPAVVTDICEQCGIHPAAYRKLFATDDSLLNAVNLLLVDECADRLRAGVARFIGGDGDGSALVGAAATLAESWPLDRSGFIIRARWRLTALSSQRDGHGVNAAERRFVGALTDILSDLLAKIARRFRWSPELAVRVILDTYERSFEAWLLAGENEATFPSSPYILRTLPKLLDELSEPA